MPVRRRCTKSNPHLVKALEKQAHFLYAHDGNARSDFVSAGLGNLRVHTAAAEKGRAYAKVVKDVLRNLELP